MKTLIIGDIHNKYEKAEKVIARNKHDNIVFLGDYFDDFGDTPPVAKRTAEWLKWSIEQSNRVHLFGNHDVHYVNPLIKMPHYGWTQDKHRFVNNVMTSEHWGKIKFHHWVDGWFLSHAGIHRTEFMNYISGITVKEFPEWIDEQSIGAWQVLKSSMSSGRHWYFRMGFSRSGNGMDFGGLLWLDFRNEFYPIIGLNQIVGHSPHNKKSTTNGKSDIKLDGRAYGYQELDYPDAQSKNYCIDTNLETSIILENGIVTLV